MKRRSHPDVIVAGLSVVDIIGKPVNVHRPPRKGSLAEIDLLTVTTGGNVSNVGIDLIKLGFRAGAVTRVGDDGLGHFLLREYAERGLETSGVTVDAGAQTAATFVAVDRSGERTFFHTRGCMAKFRSRDVLAHSDLLARSRWLVFGYLGLLPQMHAELPGLFRAIRERAGCRILLDTGGIPPRMSGRSLADLLSNVDCFVPSLAEAARLTGARNVKTIIRTLRMAMKNGTVGVKLGRKGCYVDDGGRGAYVPPVAVRSVVDTTGAGDAFVAGMVAGFLKGYDPFRAAAIGNAVAADCVSAVGASTAIRSFDSYVRS